MPTETSTPEPLAKRRKLGSGVHKPFVSPLRQRNGTNQAPARPTSSDGIFKKPATPASNLSKTTNNFVPHHPSTHPPTPTPRRSSTSLSTSATPITATTTSPSTSTISLQTHLSLLRTQIDTLKQTHRILSQNTDVELSSLRNKWHIATRSAAEELFASVKDRINRMGGVGAWREAEMRKREWVEEWAREDRERVELEEDAISDEDDDTEDSEDSEDSDEDDEDDEEDGHGRKRATKKVKLTPAEKARAKADRKAQRASLRASRLEAREAQWEARAVAKAEMAEENEEAEQEEREARKKADLEKGLVGGDDDGYTMAMMLSQLNVDFEIIGFDREAGRWVD